MLKNSYSVKEGSIMTPKNKKLNEACFKGLCKGQLVIEICGV